ncbi:MAG: class IV adenylate cyclase [Candidatus Thorarchaeota archaeon]|nr:MAG: class IV adenylate cyclase [Candidatus Thorarchaeota archaeon]RLI59903.1 MAG: class IV adenylate cyclase [Candidatus Thorarchaeota archaeon]
MSKTYEVEIKIPHSDSESIEAAILARAGTRMNSETQTDIYFDHPCRSFKDSDEAIRIRSRSSIIDEPPEESHPLVELTYKGPKIDSTTKTREEYSVGLSDADTATKILESLGFKRVATIVKRRVFYRIDDVILSLDDVAGVGTFLELEMIATGDEQMNAKRASLIQLVRDLGLDPADSVTESYLELYLKGTPRT